MVLLCKKLFFFFSRTKIFSSVSGWVMSWIWVCSRRKWSNFVGNCVVFPVGGRLDRAVMGDDCTLNRGIVFY